MKQNDNGKWSLPPPPFSIRVLTKELDVLINIKSAVVQLHAVAHNHVRSRDRESSKLY